MGSVSYLHVHLVALTLAISRELVIATLRPREPQLACNRSVSRDHAHRVRIVPPVRSALTRVAVVACHSVYHYVILRHLLLVLGRMVRQGKPGTKQHLCYAGALVGSLAHRDDKSQETVLSPVRSPGFVLNSCKKGLLSFSEVLVSLCCNSALALSFNFSGVLLIFEVNLPRGKYPICC